jgi:hypothetical protein
VLEDRLFAARAKTFTQFVNIARPLPLNEQKMSSRLEFKGSARLRYSRDRFLCRHVDLHAYCRRE